MSRLEWDGGRSPRIGSDGEGGSGRSSAPGSVVVGEGLIEGIEVGAGWCSALGFSFPLGCLVEIDLRLWRSACGSEARRPVGEGEVSEDAFDDGGVGEEGEDAQVAVASGATQGIELVDAGQELGPAEAGGAGGSRRAVGALAVGGRGGGTTAGWKCGGSTAPRVAPKCSPLTCL